MSKKVIDVSSFQGYIDWKKVKASGIQGAVLKIIRKDLTPDRQFENNWKGCEEASIPIIGVYNYSYATTVNKAKTDAQKVIDILAGRKAKVWLDVEDVSQQGMGATLAEVIKAYQKQIELAGLEFGIYTGLSFYNRNLKPYAREFRCNFWIARYPSNHVVEVSSNPMANKKPVLASTLEGWQYSSKGRIPGIKGDVDLNLWYGDFAVNNSDKEKNPYPVPKRLLSLKPTRLFGEDIKWVQYHLIRLKFLPGKNTKGYNNIDGIFGKATETAVRMAQAHFGVVADGIVGKRTIQVLQNK